MVSRVIFSCGFGRKQCITAFSGWTKSLKCNQAGNGEKREKRKSQSRNFRHNRPFRNLFSCLAPKQPGWPVIFSWTLDLFMLDLFTLVFCWMFNGLQQHYWQLQILNQDFDSVPLCIRASACTHQSSPSVLNASPVGMVDPQLGLLQNDFNHTNLGTAWYCLPHQHICRYIYRFPCLKFPSTVVFKPHSSETSASNLVVTLLGYENKIRKRLNTVFVQPCTSSQRQSYS